MNRRLLVFLLSARLVACQDERMVPPDSATREPALCLSEPDGPLLDPASLGPLDPDPSPIPAMPREAAVNTLVVSVDGMGAVFVDRMLSQGRLPNLSALRRRGASTMQARTDFSNTMTLPNHTSMVTGRPVNPVKGLAPEVHHGYEYDGMPAPGQTLHNSGNPNLHYVPSMFDVAHDAGFRTCLYAGKAKFVLYAESYSATTGAPDDLGADNGRGKIDRCVILPGNTPALVAQAAADMIGDRCDLVFFHLADLDLMGHSSRGWSSPPWYELLDTVDGWLGALGAALLRAPKPWAIVVTADHGGEGEDHSDPISSNDYRVPFFVTGPGMATNADLYQLVGGRRANPGLERPDYTASDQPIRNGDAGNLALSFLSLPQIPGSLMRDLLP